MSARGFFVSIAIAFAVLVTAAAPATAATTIDLSSQAGLRLDGVNPSDQAGFSVSEAGDVNGDDIDDVIVGSYVADGAGRVNSGVSYVVYGQTAGPGVDLATLTPAQGFRIEGAAADDWSGLSVSGAGDVNGDGRDDLIVGAPYANLNSRTNSGGAYVVYGRASAETVDLATLTPAQGFRIEGAAADDSAGFSVSGAGDVNGDGRDDVIVGVYLADNNGRSASGSAYVIYGRASGADLDLATLPAASGFRIDGAATNHQAGTSVSTAGDVNGDGRDDVIVGAVGASNNSRGFSGSSYVVYGAASSPDLDLAALSNARGFRIDGAVGGDQSGSSVSDAGDVNGDGRDDVIVGAPSANNNSRGFSGSSYVVYGAASNPDLDLAALSTARGFRVDGAVANDQSGFSVSGAGDLNGDGLDDVAVGARHADNEGRTDSGSSYLIYGQASNLNIDLLSFASNQGFRVDGAAANDESGTSVSGAGDVDGDGRADLLVGSPFTDNDSLINSGSAYLVYSAFLPRVAYAEPLRATRGEPFSASPTVFRSTGTGSVSAAPTLPAGLTLSPATGVISGTPTALGTTSHEITLVDTLGFTSTRITIEVIEATGPTGPTGPAAKGSKVKCRVKGKRSRPRARKVICRVKLAKRTRARIGWRLIRPKKGKQRKRVVRKGRFKTNKAGKGTIRVRRAGKLKRGPHILKLNGRAGGVKVRIR